MNHFYKRIPGWFSFESLYRDAVREAKDGAHFVEIGCWKGRSTAFMAVEIVNSGKNIAFECVDTWLGSPYDKHQSDPDVIAGRLFDVFMKNTEVVRSVVYPVKLESVDAASRYGEEYFDFVFIDGNHEYEAVKADIAAWWPTIKPKGVLAGDDFKGTGVKRAVLEAFEQVEAVNGGKHWRVRK